MLTITLWGSQWCVLKTHAHTHACVRGKQRPRLVSWLPHSFTALWTHCGTRTWTPRPLFQAIALPTDALMPPGCCRNTPVKHRDVMWFEFAVLLEQRELAPWIWGWLTNSRLWDAFKNFFLINRLYFFYSSWRFTEKIAESIISYIPLSPFFHPQFSYYCFVLLWCVHYNWWTNVDILLLTANWSLH